jgi:hypothetical protein
MSLPLASPMQYKFGTCIVLDVYVAVSHVLKIFLLQRKCVGTIYESFLVCHMEIMLIDFSSKVLAYHRCLSITYEIKNSRRCIRLRVDV